MMIKMTALLACLLVMGCDRKDGEKSASKSVSGTEEKPESAAKPVEAPTKTADQPAASAPGDVVEVASADPDFSTLVSALKQADLVETLQGAGPFTVFAPTNAAFEKLPRETLDAVMADKAKLASILTHHVVAGRVSASEVMKLSTATMLDGQSLPIDTSMGVRIGPAKVLKTDIAARNGLIHVIDTVLMPN